MRALVVADPAALAVAAADIVGGAVAARPDALVLAATGTTPMGCYAELARRRGDGAFDASRMRVAQLDEYVGIDDADPRSLHGWMRRSLCDPLGIGPERVIGLDPGDDPAVACRRYDAAIRDAGGIDLAVLGLGPNGHLGFNEPPSDPDAPTREVALSAASLESNAAYWGGDPVPPRAVTAGMSVILEARRVVLLVSGTRKATILERTLDGPADPSVPASWLLTHPHAIVVADQAAAGSP